MAAEGMACTAMNKTGKPTRLVIIAAMAVLWISLNYGVAPLDERLVDDDRVEEYNLKAALIYNFLKFTVWTDGGDRSLVIVGIYKDNPFGRALDNALKRLESIPRSIRAITITDDEDIADCDVLFIPRTQSGRRARILEAIGENPVLTVSEDEGLAEHGVMINFVKIEGEAKIGFEVNLLEARKRGIDFSSRMLSLARRVIR